MKKLLIGLLVMVSISAFAETTVKYSDSEKTFKLKDASVKVDRDGAYIVLELSNGAKLTHSKIGGYKDAKELAADLMDPKSTSQITVPNGWTNFWVE